MHQKIKRKGANDPLVDDATDEDASIPSNVKPIDPITEDTSEEDLLPERKKRGRRRKVHACPSNDATTKCFKSAQGKEFAKVCVKPKKMLSVQFAKLSASQTKEKNRR